MVMVHRPLCARTAMVSLVSVAFVSLAVLSTCFIDTAAATGKDVVDLDPASFQKMLKSDDVWLVEFYAPWCGHCQRLEPEWSKAATALKGVAKLGAVDMTVHQSLGGPYNVQGFPTIKIFGSNKQSPKDYNGARSSSSIVDTALSEVKNLVKARLSGKKSSSSSSSSGSGSGSKSGSGNKNAEIKLSESDFKKQVVGSDDLWMVAFIAPWCGHCKRLHPEWKKAAGELAGKVKIATVDATENQELASRYGVQGYPTIKVIMPGSSLGQAEPYEGGRDASSIVSYALNKFADIAPPPEVLQIVDGDMFTEQCSGAQICFVSFLPDIRDANAEERNKMLAIQKSLAERNKHQRFAWVWTIAGQQPALESAMDIGGFGYPAMAAVNSRRAKFATLRGAYTEKSIQEFVRQLVSGRGRTAPISGGELPAIEAVSPWDGTDAVEEVYEEEFDLSDLDDIDLDDDTGADARDEL